MSEFAQAMVFDGPGRLRSARLPLPSLAAGEVLVRVRMTTLCGSDLHTFEGRRSTPCPTILGHEILGDIESLPSGNPIRYSDGIEARVGDRVIWPITVGCGECFFCLHELPQKCERLVKYGHQRITDEHSLSGGLATHCHLVRGAEIVRVPDGLSDRVACPASCATATVAAALRHAGGGLEGACVLIQGAGMLGLTAAAYARRLGAETVLVSDVDPKRLETARRFGATHTIEIANGCDDSNRLARELTDGRGVDVALELSGASSAIEAGIELLRIGGRYLWVGAVFPAPPVGIGAETVVRKCLTIQGVHNYHPRDLTAALDFLHEAGGRHPFEELVGPTFSLGDAEQAFAAAKGGAFRVAVRP